MLFITLPVFMFFGPRHEAGGWVNVYRPLGQHHFCTLNRVKSSSQMRCPLQKCCRFCLIHDIEAGYIIGIGGLFVLLDSFIYRFFLPGMCFGFLAVSKRDIELPYKEWCRGKGTTS